MSFCPWLPNTGWMLLSGNAFAVCSLMHIWIWGVFHYPPHVPCYLSTISVHYKNLRFLSWQLSHYTGTFLLKISSVAMTVTIATKITCIMDSWLVVFLVIITCRNTITIKEVTIVAGTDFLIMPIINDHRDSTYI